MPPDRGFLAVPRKFDAGVHPGRVAGAAVRLIGYLNGDFARGAAGAIALRVVGTGLAFFMITIATRNMSAVQFGIVARWFSISCFLAVVAVAGQELLIVRSWGQYTEQGRPALARGALIFGSLATLTGALLVLGVILLAGTVVGTDRTLLWVVCPFIVAQAIMLFTSHAGRAVAGLFSGDGLREIGFRLAIIVGLLSLVAMHRTPMASDFFLFGAVGTALVVVVQIVRMAQALARKPLAPRAEYLRGEWAIRAVKMWAASLVESSNQYWDVIIVGWVLSPSAGGAYFVATRIANVFAIATGAFHALSTKTIAVLFHGAQLPALRRRFRSIAVANALLIAGGFAVLILAGRWLLSVFGPAYADQYALVLVLSAATAIIAAGGPAPALLLLTGYEATYVSIIATGALVRCVLIVTLATGLGVTGAACASATTSVVVTIALVLACRRRVGIDPSMAALINPRGSR